MTDERKSAELATMINRIILIGIAATIVVLLFGIMIGSFWMRRSLQDSISSESEKVKAIANEAVDTARSALNSAKMLQKDVENLSEIGRNLQALRDLSIPTGVIVAFVGDESEVPPGWLLCTQRTLRIGEDGGRYDALIGYLRKNWASGGDIGDPDTASVPDLRGVFLRGAQDRKHPLGAYESDSIANHTHGVAPSPLGPDSTMAAAYLYQSSSPGWKFESVPNGGVSVGAADRTGPVHENRIVDNETRPENRAVNWIIKY